MKRHFALALLLGSLLLTNSCASGGGGGGGSEAVRVGSKDFTEQFLIGEMYALVLEDAGIPVERKFKLGGTPVAQAALESDQIDLYPEYTGTGLVTVLKLPASADRALVFETVSREYKSRYDVVWLDPSPMNNAQALAMTRARATELGVRTISDLVARAGELTMIGPPEFEGREDGLPGLRTAYGAFELKRYVAVDAGLKYEGLRTGESDVAVAFGTDGEIAALDLVLLEDDKKLFPPYQVAPVVRAKALERRPEIRAALARLAPRLTDDAMRALNYEVSGNSREFADVAREFLVREGLVK